MLPIDQELFKSLSRQLMGVLGEIARGMRHVALPEDDPIRISVVIDYAETTVRHEFSPKEIMKKGD